jgi:hypothetical protein
VLGWVRPISYSTESTIYSVFIALISDFVDLTHNTNLSSLSIQNLQGIPKEITGHRSFSKIIQRILSPSITHIEIGMLVNSSEDLTWLDCEKVAYEFSHSRFSELQRVCIVLWGVPDIKDEVVASVHRDMSCLNDLNIVSVTFYDRYL